MRQATKAAAGIALLLFLPTAAAPTASRAADTGVPACVFDVDGFETSPATVAALHRGGRVAVCCLDAGSWESYRPDAGRFPRSVIGRRYEGFPDERGLDVSHFHRFGSILERR